MSEPEISDLNARTDALLSVYAIKASGNYGGGMAIVAALNEQDAIKKAATIQDQWNCRYRKPDSVSRLDVITFGQDRILEHYETGE